MGIRLSILSPKPIMVLPTMLAAKIPVTNNTKKVKITPNPGIENPSNVSGLICKGSKTKVWSISVIKKRNSNTVTTTGSQTSNPAIRYFCIFFITCLMLFEFLLVRFFFQISRYRL